MFQFWEHSKLRWRQNYMNKDKKLFDYEEQRVWKWSETMIDQNTLKLRCRCIETSAILKSFVNPALSALNTA